MGGIMCTDNSTVPVAQPGSKLPPPQEQMLWPLPKMEQYSDFMVEKRIDKRRYLLVDNQLEKVIRYCLAWSTHSISYHHR